MRNQLSQQSLKFLNNAKATKKRINCNMSRMTVLILLAKYCCLVVTYAFAIVILRTYSGHKDHVKICKEISERVIFIAPVNFHVLIADTIID